MRKLFLVSSLMVIFSASAQDVRLKQGIVTIDSKPCFKYVSKGLFGDDTTFSNMDGKTLFFLDVLDATGKNGSMTVYDKISFIGSDLVVTMSDGYGRKEIVKALIETGVISDCKFNHENIGDFANRYDQHIESSIVRPKY